MSKRKSTNESGRTLELRPEFLALGILAEGSVHGYELYRRFCDSLYGLWRISESQFYAMLKRIELRGLIAASDMRDSEGKIRHRLSLTPKGRELLLEWIETPTAGRSRLLNLDFLSRIHFARILAPERLKGLVEEQAASLREDIDRIERLHTEGSLKGVIADLSADFREGQLRAAIAWIEKRVAPAVLTPAVGSGDT